jgi:hypothetical protein
LPAPETLRVYRSLAVLGSGYRAVFFATFMRAPCSRCRRLRSSGTLAAILPTSETLRVYRSLAVLGSGYRVAFLATFMRAPYVAAAEGCDRAARSRRSC